MIEIFIYFLLFVFISISIYSDFKTFEIPDTLNFGLVFLGFIIALTYSIIEISIFPIIYSLLGFSFGFLIGSFMYHMRQWGGGDAKLLMGIGSIIGLTIPISFQSRIILFVVFTFIGGFIYTLIWMFIGLFRKKEIVKREYSKLPSYIKQINILVAFIFLTLLIINIITNYNTIFYILLLTGFVYITIYIFLLSDLSQKILMKKKISALKVTEGDWLYDDVKVNNKVVISKKTTGLTKLDIQKISKFYKQKKLKYITIKQGIQFTPAFMFGLIGLIILEILKFI